MRQPLEGKKRGRVPGLTRSRAAALFRMDLAGVCDLCLSLPQVEETTPFGPDTLVFKVAGKVFALTSPGEFPARVNLKCEPGRAMELRDEYEQAALEHLGAGWLAAISFGEGSGAAFLRTGHGSAPGGPPPGTGAVMAGGGPAFRGPCSSACARTGGWHDGAMIRALLLASRPKTLPAAVALGLCPCMRKKLDIINEQ